MPAAVLEFGERIEDASYVERICVYAIVHNDVNAIALTRTPKGYFLPGGGVDAGESLETALRRELREEINYESTVGAKVGIAVQYLYAEDEDTYFKKVGHFYRATLNDRIVPPHPTHHELVWCPDARAAELLTHEFQVWALRRIRDG